jgi:signal transduction histidine kinase
VATWFVAGRALRPVGAITDQVKEITSGTLSERVPEPKAADEVGVLARTMNTMLGRLENSDLRRRQFVSDASHEFRTPVAVLRSEAEVARRAPDSTSIDDLASVVLGESKRLEGLVEDLLSLARGDEARSLDATAAIDVDEIVLAEAERTRALAVDKRAVSAGRVIGHEDDMHRVIAHLLDNSARHGESTVAVGVETMSETVRIWVDDDGPGITEDERERIFGRFIRLDDARNRDVGGAGLGLAVVHETVARMKGTIEVLDSPLGGARFQIELPAA